MQPIRADSTAHAGVFQGLQGDGGDRQVHRLETGTKSVCLPHREKPPRPGPWLLTVYPGACEAVITYAPQGEGPGRLARARADAEDGAIRPECAEVAARRARSMVRRLCRQYRLRYMWTLTYRGAGCHEYKVVARHIEGLARWLRRRRLAWVAVPELHPGGHGYHVHLALAEYVPWQEMVRAWCHGHVQSPRVRQRGRAVRTAKLGVDRVIGYLCKYISKAMGGDGHVRGQRRYWRGRSMQLARERSRYWELADALAHLARLVGARPCRVLEVDRPGAPYIYWVDWWVSGRGGRPPQAVRRSAA